MKEVAAAEAKLAASQAKLAKLRAQAEAAAQQAATAVEAVSEGAGERVCSPLWCEADQPMCV